MAKGEYEPKDSRNVTGTASTEDGRWTNRDGTPPLANGEHPHPPEYLEYEDEDEDEDDDVVYFEPSPELAEMLRKRRTH